MITIAAGILVTAVFALSGTVVLKKTGFNLECPENKVFGFALTAGLFSYNVLFLAFSGIKASMLWTLFSIFAAIAIFSLKDLRRSGEENRFLSREIYPFLTLAGISFFVTFAGVLIPDLSNDSLCYHLNLPKIFLSISQLPHLPYEVNSVFPMLMEMLYTFSLGVGLPHLAQFFHFAMGLTAVAAIFLFARKSLGLPAAWGAALLFGTTPGILNEMSTTYVDVALAAYTLLAVLAVYQWTESRNARWLALAGIFSGFAMSVKYLAAISILGLGLIILWSAWRSEGGAKAFRAIVLYLSAAFICGAFWYLRSWVLTGNPVYPYFYSVFKAGDPTIHYDDVGVGKSLLAFLKVPWTATMHPEIFEGYGVQIGPGYLIFIPLGLLCCKKYNWLKPFAFFAVFYSVLWFFLGQSLRFLFPVLPVFALIAGAGMELLAEHWRKLSRLVIAAILGLNTVFAVYHYRHAVPVALGLESKENYLKKWERSYEPALYANQNLPQDAKILAADETHLFYFERPVVRESVYARITKYDQKASDLDTVFRELREEGFTHILQGKVLDAAPGSFGAFRVPYLLEKGQNGLALYLKPLYTKKFTGPDGRTFIYNLYEIRNL